MVRVYLSKCPVRKTVFFLLGFFIICVVAFQGTMIFWPQDNQFETVQIEIPRGASLSSISKSLKDQNILTNENTFLMAVKIMGYEAHMPAGKFMLYNPKTNYRIINQLIKGKPILQKVTLLEGWTMKKVAEVLGTELGIKKAEVMAICSDKIFIESHNIPSETLEGFLFPETYFFQENDSPKNIISQILMEYKKNIFEKHITYAQGLGINELELVTLASIIEGEAIFDSERPIISAVYHNRLNLGMKLQADPTIQYLIEDSPRRLLNRDLEIKSPYNTYIHKGLPPTPVNNPGKASLHAALYPEKNDYLYFVARGDGYHTFSKTQEEHNKAKKEFQKFRRKHLNK